MDDNAPEVEEPHNVQFPSMEEEPNQPAVEAPENNATHDPEVNPETNSSEHSNPDASEENELEEYTLKHHRRPKQNDQILFFNRDLDTFQRARVTS